MDEINIITMGSKDHHHQSMIMKGKRTKRPRQPSPASAVFTASSCSSGGDGGGGGDRKLHTKIRSSDSLCSEILSTSTDEDEDMANCLILLAHSGRENKMMTTPTHINNNIGKQEGGEIHSSKKFKEVTTTSSSTIGGKDNGTYVYECKTCNRSFPSFQALGGHRTSHKKHKPTVEMEAKKGKNDHHNQEKIQYDEEEKEEEEKGMKRFKISPSSLLSLETANKKSSHGNIVINNNKVKIHECSICGAEFSSGQALGGHMRRHRNPTTNPAGTTNTTTESSPDNGGRERKKNILELDLNMPAPPEDDDLHDSQFQFSLFSSASLVDCQY